MRNESSVSIWADREFKLVDPKRVRTGGADGLGESQIPKGINSDVCSFYCDLTRRYSHLSHDMSTLAFPTRSIKHPDRP